DREQKTTISIRPARFASAVLPETRSARRYSPALPTQRSYGNQRRELSTATLALRSVEEADRTRRFGLALNHQLCAASARGRFFASARRLQGTHLLRHQTTRLQRAHRRAETSL